MRSIALSILILSGALIVAAGVMANDLVAKNFGQLMVIFGGVLLVLELCGVFEIVRAKIAKIGTEYQHEKVKQD